jgi:hypothetical protein
MIGFIWLFDTVRDYTLHTHTHTHTHTNTHSLSLSSALIRHVFTSRCSVAAFIIITRGRYNRPFSSRRAEWTQLGLHPPLWELKKISHVVSYSSYALRVCSVRFQFYASQICAVIFRNTTPAHDESHLYYNEDYLTKFRECNFVRIVVGDDSFDVL